MTQETRPQRKGTNGAGKFARSLLASVGVLSFLGSPVFGLVTIRVTTSDAFTGGDGVPPSPATMSVRLERESPSEVATTVNFDLIFQTSQFDLAGSCDDGSSCQLSETCPNQGTCRFTPVRCQKDSRLVDHVLEVVPPDFQNVASGEYRLRFALVATSFSNPLPVISDGQILTCTLPPQPTAAPGPQAITFQRLQVGDNAVPAQSVPAQLVLELGRIVAGTPPTETPTPSATPTETPTAATPTPTESPATETPTPSLTPGTPIPRTPCPSPRPTPQGPAVYLEDVILAASGPVTLTVRLAAGGREIVATQNDLVWTGGIRIAPNSSGRPDCAVNPALNKNGSTFGFLPAGCSGGACTGVRAVVVSLDNVDPIPDGAVLYTCVATLSDVEARVDVTGVVASDALGSPVPGVGGRDGFVCVEPPPTPTPTLTFTSSPRPPSPTNTSTVPGATATPTPTPSSTAESRTPTATRTTGTPTATRTPTGAAAEGGNGCDCNVASGAGGGWSSAWLLLPALFLRWRRRLGKV